MQRINLEPAGRPPQTDLIAHSQRRWGIRSRRSSRMQLPSWADRA